MKPKTIKTNRGALTDSAAPHGVHRKCTFRVRKADGTVVETNNTVLPGEHSTPVASTS